jgi:hypothetical protein
MKPELQAVGAERSMAKQRTKAEETAKNAAKVAREGHQITNRSRLDLEIRFAKTQQLAVATATMTLLGAILGIGHLFKPLYTWEKRLGIIGAAITAIIGIEFIWSLYVHLSKTRLEIDAKDTKAWQRGMWVTWAFIFTLFVGAVVVGYALNTLPREVPVPSFE